jgi:hypothetical protein
LGTDCAIYEDELQRIWPLDEENRKAKIAQFAKEYGFKLSFYKTRAMRHLRERTVAARRNEVMGIIAGNLSKAGWSWGCSSEIDSTGRVLYTADA